MSKNVLIVTAASGAGHNSVAHSLSEAFERARDGRARVTVVDLLALADAPAAGRANRLYAPIIVHHPRLWGLLYGFSNHTAVWRLARAQMGRIWDGLLARLLQSSAPDVVLCVHPVCNQIVAHGLRQRCGTTPLVTVITDLGGVHAAWVTPRTSMYVAPTVEVQADLLAGEIDEQHVSVLGLPLRTGFTHEVDDGLLTRRSLGLDGGVFTVLLTGGGEGAGAILSTARSLSRERLPVQLIVLCGHNQALRRTLERSQLSIPCRALGFTSNVPALMRASDAVVGKGGALTIGEAVVTRRPPIVLRPLPGQEQGNAAFVLRHGLGVVACNPADVVDTLREWMARPSAMRALVDNAAGFRRCWAGAADQVAAASLELAEGGGTRAC